MEVSKRNASEDVELSSGNSLLPEEYIEDPFSPAPLRFETPSLKSEDAVVGMSAQKVPEETKTPAVADSTLLADPSSVGPSRLAHRFAPIPDPLLLSVFPDPGGRYELEQETTVVIGRDPRRSDIVLFSPSVSQKHCHIVVDDDECILVDLESSNGTFVNGEKISAPHTLRQGDLLTIGRYVFMFLWFRFGREPQSEVLYYRDLKDLMTRLYPTSSSIQTLLLATNLFNLHVDLGKGTPEQIWEALFEQLRRQDVLGSLEMITSCTLRDHAGNRELRRILDAVEYWKTLKKAPGLQERINTDARNSARVVREILENFLETTGDSDSISQMMDEVTEEARLESRAKEKIPARPTPELRSLHAPAELPFDFREDSASNISVAALPGGVLTPSARRPTVQTEDRGGWSVSATDEPVSDDLASLQPVDSELHATFPVDLETGEGVGESASGVSFKDGRMVQLPDGASAHAFSHDEGALATNVHVPYRDEAAPVQKSSVPARLVEKPRSWARMIGFGAAAVVTAVAAIYAVNMNPNKETQAVAIRDTGAADNVPAAVASLQPPAADSGKEKVVENPPDDKGMEADGAKKSAEDQSPGASESTNGKTISAEAARTDQSADKGGGGENTVIGAPESQAKEGVAPPVQLAAANDATKPSAPPGSGAGSAVPVQPQFQVINFLNAEGAPAYSKSSFTDESIWDSQTNQLLGASLHDCMWVDERKMNMANKGGKIFLYIRCSAGTTPVEGWVFNKAMKRSQG